MYVYIYKHIYIEFTKKCHSQTFLSWSGDSQVQERFLAPSADKQTCNYDRECLNHHLSQSPEGTGIEPWQDKMVIPT